MEKLKKVMLITICCFVIFVLAMFIMAKCNKKNYTSEEFNQYLLDASKSYYKTRKDMLPKNNGGKTNISISALVEKQEKYIGKDKTCSGNIEVTNNNGFYMYSSNINCSDGYKSEKLSAHLTSPDKIVTTGNGVYFINGKYIYRGDSVNNFLLFNNQLWRIVGVNEDNTIRIIESDYVLKNKKKENLEFKSKRRESVVWDDRYNTEKDYKYGFNDYVHDNINSRIKDSLEIIYNSLSDDAKGYVVTQNLCVGKRSKDASVNDGSIECSNVINDQYIGLLQLNEYINASLDPTCLSAASVTCSNYNYLSTFKSTFWTITGMSENTYQVYKVGSRIVSASASSNSTPKVVLNLSSETSFSSGDGTQENPYKI